MSEPQRNYRHIRAAEKLDRGGENVVPREEKCGSMRDEILRDYLVERRRALLTELDALDRLLTLTK